MPKDDTDLKQAMFQVSDGVIGAAVLIVIGVLGGQWLDSQFHSGSLWTIVLSMTGGALGLIRLVMKAMQIGGDSPAPNASKLVDLSKNENDDTGSN